MNNKTKEDELSYKIIGAAMTVHTELGPGLLESVYEACLCRELMLQGLQVERQVPVPVRYKDVELDCGFRLDMLVENCVIVEVKTIEKIAPIHEAQALTYLKLTGKQLCMLLNFNVVPKNDMCILHGKIRASLWWQSNLKRLCRCDFLQQNSQVFSGRPNSSVIISQ